MFHTAAALAEKTKDVEAVKRFTDALTSLRDLPLADLHLHLTSIVGSHDIGAIVQAAFKGGLGIWAFRGLRAKVVDLAAGREPRRAIGKALDELRRVFNGDKNDPAYLDRIYEKQSEFEAILQEHTTQSLSAEDSVSRMKAFFEQFQRLKAFADPEVKERRQAFTEGVARMEKRGLWLVELRGLHAALETSGVRSHQRHRGRHHHESGPAAAPRQEARGVAHGVRSRACANYRIRHFGSGNRPALATLGSAVGGACR